MAEVNEIFNSDEAKKIIDVGNAISKADDALLKLIKDSESLIEILNKNNITIDQLNKANVKANETTIKIIKVNDSLKKSEETLSRLEKERIKIREQQKTLLTKNIAAEEKSYEVLQKGKLALQQKNAEIKRNIIIAKSQEGAYNKINASLNQNIAKWKALSSEERNNTKIGGQLLKTIQRQDSELKKLDTQIGRSQRNVGKYGSALFGVGKRLIGAFGVVGGVTAFASVLKNTFSTIANFDKANATLAATLGTTKDQISDLTENAIELGRVTQFTASEVSELQNELAKLGFLKEEIKASTAGVLDLAAATDADLGEAAKVAGQALRAFGLDASEMNRVVSVLAVATTKSALSFEDYGAGLSNVAPVAKSFGFSIEDTIALFGKLKDAGFDASKSTTATRNIILNLADANGALSKELGRNIKSFDEFIPALIELRDRGVDLNTTLELTDKRSVAAFNTFLGSAESAMTLRDSLVDVNAQLADMVETKTDNVIGASRRLGSAWEGLILKFRESSGVIQNLLDGLASAINLFSNESISYFDKVFFWRGSKRQAELDEMSKQLRTATLEQIENTLKLHEKELESGSKTDKKLLQMLKDRQTELEKAQIASRERMQRDEEQQIAQENFRKEQAQKDAAEKNEKKRLASEKKANEEIEKERIRHNQEIRKIDQKIIEDESKRRAKEAIERETEFNELKSNLDIEALEKWKEINLERAASDQAYMDSVLDLEEQKRMAKMDTLDIVRSVFGEETAIGKIATAIQRVEAIKQNLISLGVITAKQAEGVAKSAAAAPFPFNLPLIAGTVAQFVSIFSLFKKSKVQGFWKGTENAPGKFIAGERGRELMMLKTGELMMVDTPTYFEGNKYKGATIKSNPETEKIISKAQNSNNFVFDTADLKNEMRLVRLAIEKKPVSITDRRGSIIGKQSGNYREIYLNKLKNGR